MVIWPLSGTTETTITVVQSYDNCGYCNQPCRAPTIYVEPAVVALPTTLRLPRPFRGRYFDRALPVGAELRAMMRDAAKLEGGEMARRPTQRPRSKLPRPIRASAAVAPREV